MGCRIRDAVAGVDMVSLKHTVNLYLHLPPMSFLCTSDLTLDPVTCGHRNSATDRCTGAVVISRRGASGSSKWLESHVPSHRDWKTYQAVRNYRSPTT
jgi:hypothetical protein